MQGEAKTHLYFGYLFHEARLVLCWNLPTVDIITPERIHRCVAWDEFQEKERHADRVGHCAFESKDAWNWDARLLADAGEGVDFVHKSLAELRSAAVQL